MTRDYLMDESRGGFIFRVMEPCAGALYPIIFEILATTPKASWVLRAFMDTLKKVSSESESLKVAPVGEANEIMGVKVCVRKRGSEDGLLAVSQAIHLALQCEECSIGGEHREMLEKHAEMYEIHADEQERSRV